MENEIKSHLKTIENTFHIQILYAAESGSKAYGTGSLLSDHDIRFIYVHPLKNYLKIERPSESIVVSKDPKIEFHGWDLFKAMKLFIKSNPSMYEALFSPIIHLEVREEIDDLREIAKKSFSLRTLFLHYLQMTKSNFHSLHLTKDVEINSYRTLKVVLHCIRAILAIHYLDTYKKLPPIPFKDLILESQYTNESKKLFFFLLEIKCKEEISASYLSKAEFNTYLQFIQEQLSFYQNRYEQQSIDSHDKMNKHLMNKIIWKILHIDEIET